MTLIKSISGIRGTIGGKPGEGLSPFDIMKFTAGYGQWVKERHEGFKPRVVVGRDARASGGMLDQIVCGTLMGLGIDVINIGLATTPTVEMAVTAEQAHGGIILTASHNPGQWNALKLLHEKGEFLDALEGKDVLGLAEQQAYDFAEVDDLGRMEKKKNYHEYHIKKILELPEVKVNKIKKAKFKVAIDCVNSVGGIVIPELLHALGVKKVIPLYCEPNGKFPHNPEPLPEHLEDLSKAVVKNKANLGFTVDPDVDRLAIVNEDGSMFGEEYTLVAVADYILSKKKGNTVSNLSSSRALKDITEKHGGAYVASAVGEVNVVKSMKVIDAVIGGEGNGGVIYPELHYGRDALVGIALFLSHLAEKKVKCSGLKKEYPFYVISKNKAQLGEGTDVDAILKAMKEKYADHPINDIDGVKIEMDKEWVHLRKSNTEPIIRIYAEAATRERADELARQIMQEIQEAK
jgi:phosphomannomutase